MVVKFKSDKYRKARGNYSRFLNVLCEHCGAKILVYQKDGPGPLKRLYLDRIFAPEDLINFQKIVKMAVVGQSGFTNKICIAQRAMSRFFSFAKGERQSEILLNCRCGVSFFNYN